VQEYSFYRFSISIQSHFQRNLSESQVAQEGMIIGAGRSNESLHARCPSDLHQLAKQLAAYTPSSKLGLYKNRRDHSKCSFGQIRQWQFFDLLQVRTTNNGTLDFRDKNQPLSPSEAREENSANVLRKSEWRGEVRALLTLFAPFAGSRVEIDQQVRLGAAKYLETFAAGRSFTVRLAQA
jgi:hypothetical protein